MRSLVMIAKCLQVQDGIARTYIIESFQNLANLVEFGGKEPYMEVNIDTLANLILLIKAKLENVTKSNPGCESLHPKEQGKDGGVPRPPVQRPGKAIP